MLHGSFPVKRRLLATTIMFYSNLNLLNTPFLQQPGRINVSNLNWHVTAVLMIRYEWVTREVSLVLDV